MSSVCPWSALGVILSTKVWSAKNCNASTNFGSVTVTFVASSLIQSAPLLNTNGASAQLTLRPVPQLESSPPVSLVNCLQTFINSSHV